MLIRIFQLAKVYAMFYGPYPWYTALDIFMVAHGYINLLTVILHNVAMKCQPKEGPFKYSDITKLVNLIVEVFGHTISSQRKISAL